MSTTDTAFSRWNARLIHLACELERIRIERNALASDLARVASERNNALHARDWWRLSTFATLSALLACLFYV